MNTELRKGDHRAFSRPEIAVAYKHIDRVRRALARLNVGHSLVASDRYLGLGLIRLDSDVAAAWAVHGHDPDWEETVGATEEPTEGDGSSTYLDSFLRGLRGYFSTTQAGWRPIVGKNRVVGLVTTTPGTVWHGGGGPLAQAEKGQDLRPRTRRERLYGTGVTVGLLDTGIASHEWLAGGWTSAPDDVFIPTPKDRAKTGPPLPNGAAGHATFVAGLILDKAPGCVVRAMKVLDDEGKATSWEVATKLVRLARSKPDIINLSLVCYTEDGEPPLVLATAIDRIPSEVVVVAAAGNHGGLTEDELSFTREQVEECRKQAVDERARARLRRRLGVTEVEYKKPIEDLMELLVKRERRKPGWPAAFERVLAVGSGQRATGKPSPFTPSDVGWIDALADGEGKPPAAEKPGPGVVSTYPPGFYSVVEEVVTTKGGKKTKETVTKTKEFTGGYAVWGGTSFSAASLSGAIAARTKPGRVSARQALEALLPPVQPRDADARVSSTSVEPKPRFPKLDDPPPDKLDEEEEKAVEPAGTGAREEDSAEAQDLPRYRAPC